MTEETITVPTKKSEKTSSRSRDKSNKWDKAKVLKKVIIRRLPPSMNEETFLEQIEPLPDHESYYFVPADWSLGHDATARAYINFLNQDDIFLFKDRFDGYVFVDNKGAEYQAIVEFAPFQGLPRNKSRKKDPKASSIETDPHYISFLENLTKEDTDGVKEFKLEYSFQLKDDKKITSTPLLQYLANKKQERRDERKRKLDEKRRQRDEERQRKKVQIAKNIPQSIAEEDGKTPDKPKEKSGEKRRDRRDEDRKEARNRRREQKRKEERERRAAERGSGENIEPSTVVDNKLPDNDDTKKKDTKKYNQSRQEKQRNRDENRQKDKDTNNSKSATQIPISKSSEINETVKEFIKNVVISQELPKLHDTSASTSTKADNEATLIEVREKLQQLSTSLEDGKAEKKSSEFSGNKQEKRERNTEKSSRRIRNKDRPSIEIYQPRKMRSSTNKDESGRSSCELKDYKSNPTSDCESVKKEKDEKSNVRKKVSRYSERRSGRTRERSAKDDADEKEKIEDGGGGGGASADGVKDEVATKTEESKAEDV